MEAKWKQTWNRSTQPRKQRKYRYNAPLHIKRKFMSVNLAKDLRIIHKKKSTIVRKGDKIKILRGQFKGKIAKVEKVLTKYEKLYIEGITITKKDGNKVFYPVQPSNVQIIELKIEDKKRKAKLERK